jgi:hypothetical protein
LVIGWLSKPISIESGGPVPARDEMFRRKPEPPHGAIPPLPPGGGRWTLGRPDPAILQLDTVAGGVLECTTEPRSGPLAAWR